MVDPKSFPFRDRVWLGLLRFGIEKMDNTAADYVVNRIAFINKYKRAAVEDARQINDMTLKQKFWYRYANFCLAKLSPAPLGWISQVLIGSQRQVQEDKAKKLS